MAYRLGIDTGGTYTDVVLIDSNRKVVASCKSLTTRQDLSLGIASAMSTLPPEMLSKIELVSLSTTLTTNSVVEGRGADVGVLLAGYSERQLEKSGLSSIVPKSSIALLSGGHDATGHELTPLDENAAREYILKYKDHVSAFAVSSMFATRNTEHERRLQSLVQTLCDKPVACAHELATSLGAPQRALTAVLNARMIPYIQALLRSVENILLTQNIQAPLMIVKGDGSLINTKTALEQPISTVLSGPAASVVGACALSGLKNAIVVDMGGTTTDIAIVSNGQPTLSADGAKVGDWQPMIEAVKIFCVGLGGDSEVAIKGAKGLVIGPKRVVPISLLAKQYPWVSTRLKQQLKAYPNARHNKFVLALESTPAQLDKLNASQLTAWERLKKGPIELDQASETDSELAKSLSKLQRLGLAIFSGFTPTDAAHVLDLSNHLDKQAAIMAAQIWANQMRCLYGLGQWENNDAHGPSRTVIDLLVENISETLIEASLHQLGMLSQAKSAGMAKLLTQLIISNHESPSDSDHQALFNLDFCADYPLVAVGAPAKSYYPQVAKKLNMQLVIPENAEVANAVGAVMGAVIQRSVISVSQPSTGIFRLYHKQQPQQFSDLSLALKRAEELASTEAQSLAVAAGASNVDIAIEYSRNQVSNAIDGDVFFDCDITAIATGRPSYAKISH